MHSGFQALRSEMPMDVHARAPAQPSDACAADIARIVSLWRDLRRQASGGPWLLGAWSIADAFYAPVALRLRTYGVDLAAHGDDGRAAAYLQTALADPALQEWEAAA
jgi:glutathione S-transferase